MNRITDFATEILFFLSDKITYGTKYYFDCVGIDGDTWSAKPSELKQSELKLPLSDLEQYRLSLEVYRDLLLQFNSSSAFDNCKFTTYIQDRIWSRNNYIPLTADWLTRFGFIADNYNVFYKTETNEPNGRCQLWCHHFEKDGDVIWDCHIGQEFGELTFVREIKYVHQLMNLFFAKTGSELSLNQ